MGHVRDQAPVHVQVFERACHRENVSARDSDALVQYISSRPYVKSYEYVTKDNAKKKYLDDGNKDWGAVLDKNPLPASVNFKIRSVYGKNILRIRADLRDNDFVTSGGSIGIMQPSAADVSTASLG